MSEQQNTSAPSRRQPLTPTEWNTLPVYLETVVPDDYIDDMGHMNVMWYTHMFSRALWSFFQEIGLTRQYFETQHTGSFALEQNFRYLAEIRVGERVTLRLRILGRSEKRLHFMGFIIKEDSSQLAATAEVVTAHIDMTCRRSSPFPESITQAYDRYLNQHTQLPWPPPTTGHMHP